MCCRTLLYSFCKGHHSFRPGIPTVTGHAFVHHWKRRNIYQFHTKTQLQKNDEEVLSKYWNKASLWNESTNEISYISTSCINVCFDGWIGCGGLVRGRGGGVMCKRCTSHRRHKPFSQKYRAKAVSVTVQLTNNKCNMPLFFMNTIIIADRYKISITWS